MEPKILEASKMLSALELSFVHECLTLSVDVVNVYDFTPLECFDMHSHSNYEFHFICDGKGTLICESKAYPLSPGTFFLTGPGISHNQIADEKDPMKEYALRCGLKISATASPTNYPEAEFSQILKLLNEAKLYFVPNAPMIREIFETIFLEMYHKQPGYFTQIKSNIVRLIITAARAFTPASTANYAVPKRNLHRHRLNLIQHFIASNSNRNITCTELAKHLYLSNKQLDRVIRTQTGLSAHQFILSYKIDIIKHFLKETKMPLWEIAEKTGFSSEFHLSTSFKKHEGIPPSAYRISHF